MGSVKLSVEVCQNNKEICFDLSKKVFILAQYQKHLRLVTNIEISKNFLKKIYKR